MTLVFSGKAEIVEEYDNVEIRSMRESFKLPSILRLIKSFSRRKYVKFSRSNIFWRDRFRCQYCDAKPATDDLTFDHVIPRSRGTPESRKSWENIVTACLRCNQKKADRTPQEAGMRLLKKPTKPRWTPQMTIRLKATDPEAWRSYVYWTTELDPV